MEVPLTWLRDYIDIELDLEALAKTLTMLGMEVEGIRLVGMNIPANNEGQKHEFTISGISWSEDKFVVAEVQEVMPHPNADRLVLCRLFDGTQEITVLTGAPNLYEFIGQRCTGETAQGGLRARRRPAV